MASQPPPSPPPTLALARCVRTCDLVVARCDEDVEWVARQAPRYRRVELYNKCNRTLPSSLSGLKNVETTSAPNVTLKSCVILHNPHYE